MNVGERLKRGALGVRLELPPTARVTDESRTEFTLVDDASGVHWWVMLFPALRMDLSEVHRDHLRRGLSWPARAMFEALHAQTAGPDARPPRTADATWSPMVDAEFVRCGAADVLRTVHRMRYEPGSELVMGHVMAQLPAGLFEVRVLARNHGPTGMREVALMLANSKGIPMSLDAQAPMSQSEYDDPTHDEAVPDHPLSRVREAQRWVTSKMQVEAPAPPSSNRVQNIVERYAFTLPPRFSEGADGIHRVSFCGTDGVQRLFVERLRRTADLEAVAQKHARSKHREPSVRRVELDVSRSPSTAPRQVVYVRVRAETHQHAFGNEFAYFEAAGALWSVGLTNTLGIPTEETSSDLNTVVTSFEAEERAARRWWPFG